jgi:hypothetical protein
MDSAEERERRNDDHRPSDDQLTTHLAPFPERTSYRPTRHQSYSMQSV